PGSAAPESARKASAPGAAKGSAKQLGKAGATGRPQFKAASAEVLAYKSYLKSRQAEHLQKITQLTGRHKVTQEFQLAANAVVMSMTQDEARKVSRLPNVRFVERNRALELNTDRGPTWIGAPAIWDGSAYQGAGTFGEGVLVGILDSGAAIGVALDPADAVDGVGPLTHFSFMDAVDIPPALVESDQYDHQWAGGYLGACDPGNPDQYIAAAAGFCTDKLVGVYSFINAQAACQGVDPTVASCDQFSPTSDPIWNVKDTDGHGSHVASTVSGNFLFNLPIVNADGQLDPGFIIPQISGVAPHANIIAYKVCAPSCFFSDIAAATEQAILDGVDVLNMSIGNSNDPWGSLTAQTFLSANTAGIAVANSAGNAGPNPGTATGANSSPWVLGVGASTHDRRYPPKALDPLSGGDTTPPVGISGLAITGGYTGDIVYAGDFPVGVAGEPNFDQPEQCLEPFPAGTFPADTIVLCDRGAIARVAKGQNVRDGGAAGLILANIPGGATSVVADPHVIPAIHIDATFGDEMRVWLATGSGHAGTITPGLPAESDPAVADIMAGFSSRGPFPGGLDLLAPHVSAPGQDIYAAGAGNLFVHQGVGNDAPAVNELFGQISGTSMSSPHAAGSMALLTAIYPNWSADARHSALITTGTRDMRKEDGATPADPFDFGGGRVQPSVAVNVGLIFEESEANYQAANPADGGDPSTLNVAHAVSNACVQSCSWERTVTAVADDTWTVVPGTFTSADIPSFTLSAGESQTLVITADSSALPADDFAFDTLGFAPANPAHAEQHVTIAVAPARGDIPGNVNIDASRDADSLLVQNLTAIEITDLTTVVYGFNKADQEDFSVMQDSDNSSPYDDLSDGVVYKLTPFVDNAQRFIAEITASESPDLDMFVGLDFNGDGLPSEDEEFCVSASGTAFEVCDFELGGDLAGFPDWWVLIQNWGASGPPPTSDAFTLAITSVGPADTGTLSLVGPSAQPQLEPFDVRLFWDAPMDQGDIFYGRINLSADASGDPTSFIGTMDVRAERGTDDVVISALPDQIQVGDTATVTASVLKNFTPEDRSYEISIPIPDGLTYVDGSADASGGVFDGSAVNFSITQESLVGRTPDYAQFTNDPGRGDYDASCTLPFGLGSYIDLAGFGIAPIAGGDDDTFSISGLQPMPFYGTDRGTAVNVNTNGFLFFDSTPGPFDGFINFPIPDATDPNDMIAVLWKDLIVPNSGTLGGSGISAGGFTCGPPCFSVIEFDDATDWETETASYDAQAFIVASENLLGPYELFIGFDNVDFGSPANDFVTVGVENPNGDQGTQYAYDTLTSSISSGLLVCYDLLPLDTTPDALSFQVFAGSGSAGQSFDLTETDTVDSPGSAEDSSTATIQVSQYLFTGFRPPVVDGSVHRINRTLPITFEMVDGNTGQPVPGLTVGVVIYDSGMNVVVDDVYDNYRSGAYRYLWRTSGLAAGEYTIAAVLPDGIVRKIKVIMRD
ncbi:MAG: S8 family serine peptidase, partial [Gammaproteobacteria bacterium]